MTSDLAQRIRNVYPYFSKAQKKLANTVLNSYEKIAGMTAARLGRHVGVSESTVVRFAGALGFDRYAEFQKAIEDLLRKKLTLNQRIDATKKRIYRRDIIENVMKSDIDRIRDTMERLDKKTFSDSVDAIIRAKTIYIIGARGSEAIAKMLQYNLSLIFDKVKFVLPSSTAEVFEQMYSIGKEDTLIAFCYPRYSSKVVNAVKYAKDSGANVILFTDTEASPPAEYATLLLLAQIDIASFMDSLVAPLCIINALIIEITNRCEGEIRRRFDKLESVWDEYGVYTKEK